MALLLGLIVLGLGWILPGHYHPWLSFQHESLAAAGALLIAVAAVLPINGQRMRWPVLAVVTLATALVPLAQLSVGQIRFVSDAMFAALYLAGFALSMVAGAALVQARRTEFIGGLFAAFLVAGIASTGMAAWQWLQLGPVGYVGDLAPYARPYANLAQPNHLATLLALALVGLLWLFETRRIGATTAALAAAWLGLGMVITQSRTGWLFVLSLAVGILLVRRRTATRTTPIAVGVALALFVAVSLAWQPLSQALLVSAEDVGGRLQASMRLLLWRAFIHAIGSSPWVGYGWTQVELAAQAASLDLVTQQGMFVNGHNLVLDLLLWNGMPLGLLLVGVLTWWITRQLRRCDTIERWMLFAAVGAVFIHAMFEYPLEYLYFLLPLGLLMGALDGLDPDARAWQAPRWIAALPLPALTAMLVWIAVEYLAVEESSRQLRMVVAGIGVDKVRSIPPPDVRLLDAPRELHRYMVTPARAQMTAAEVRWMRTVTERNPMPPALLRYATAAGLNGQPGEATDALTRLCFMHGLERCREGRDAWQKLQQTYPKLETIAFPPRAVAILSPPH